MPSSGILPTPAVRFASAATDDAVLPLSVVCVLIVAGALMSVAVALLLAWLIACLFYPGRFFDSYTNVPGVGTALQAVAVVDDDDTRDLSTSSDAGIDSDETV